MRTYSTRVHKDASIRGNKEAVKNALVEIYVTNAVLTPDLVIKAARKKDSALHGEFEWDNKKAADRHRHSQALYLIRIIQIEVRTSKKAEPVRYRAYISPSLETRDTNYIDIRDAIKNPKQLEIIKEKLWRRLNSMIEELNQFQEFQEVIEAIKSGGSG